MKVLVLTAVLMCAVLIFGCGNFRPMQNNTILFGGGYNMNGKCVGHYAGVCGPEDKDIKTSFAGMFATDAECQGLKIRALTKEEESIPIGKLPLLLQVMYVGTPHTETYYGTGKGETEGWLLSFNGPNGHFSATVKTEQEAVHRVCLATKGHGGEVDNSVGYTQ